MLRKGRPRRYSQESDEATDIFRRLGDKLTIPLHDLGCLAEGPQHRPAIDSTDRMQPKQEGGDDAKVATTTAYAPEQVGILFSTGGDQTSICQDHIHGEEIVNGETAFTGQMAELPAQGEAANASGGDNTAGRGQAKGMRSVIHI